MKNQITLEACVETLEQAMLAQKSGAHRLELCSDLSVGGLTPDDELLKQVISKVTIPVMVMIRPRAGDFFYLEEELLQMEEQIRHCRQMGVAGIVLGLLTTDLKIDRKNTIRLCQLAKSTSGSTPPLSVTFHKAIDELKDPVEGVKTLCNMHGLVNRILTSGGAQTALEGAETLKKMMVETHGSGELQILPAGRITKDNLEIVHSRIGAREYHGRRIVF